MMHEINTMPILFASREFSLRFLEPPPQYLMRYIYRCHDMPFSALFRTKIPGYIPMFAQHFTQRFLRTGPNLLVHNYTHSPMPRVHTDVLTTGGLRTCGRVAGSLPLLRKKRLIEGPYGPACMVSQLSSFSILFLVARGTRCIRLRPSNDTSLRMTRYGYGGTWEKGHGIQRREGVAMILIRNI